MQPIAALFASRKFVLLLVVVVCGLVAAVTHQIPFADLFKFVAGGFALLATLIAYEDAAEKGAAVAAPGQTNNVSIAPPPLPTSETKVTQ